MVWELDWAPNKNVREGGGGCAKTEKTKNSEESPRKQKAPEQKPQQASICGFVCPNNFNLYFVCDSVGERVEIKGKRKRVKREREEADAVGLIIDSIPDEI